MSAITSLISCNFTSPLLPPKTPRKPTSGTSLASLRSPKESFPLVGFSRPNITNYHFRNVGWWSLKRGHPVCFSVLNSEETEKEKEKSEPIRKVEGRDWTTSILLSVFYGGLMYYVFNLSPNQTPSTDLYFLERLLNLKGDDGFRMNEVIVALWYIMGLWPLVYSMLLLPTARRVLGFVCIPTNLDFNQKAAPLVAGPYVSPGLLYALTASEDEEKSIKSKIPVWPFCVLSFFGGAYALLPYFVVWKPPPPSVDESELGKWPLNFLESKLTAGFCLAAGLGLMVYTGLAGGDSWMEFNRYFRSSKFIHVTSIDFCLLSTFAPFWVYNDMTARRWFDKGSWLLPVSLVPLIGPSLYLILRPPLSELPESSERA